MGRGPPTRTGQVSAVGRELGHGSLCPGDQLNAQQPDAQNQPPRGLSGDRKLARWPHIPEVEALAVGLGPSVLQADTRPLSCRGGANVKGVPTPKPIKCWLKLSEMHPPRMERWRGTGLAPWLWGGIWLPGNGGAQTSGLAPSLAQAQPCGMCAQGQPPWS